MKDWIRSAIDKGEQSLSEYEAKRVLESYGIPVTRESLVQTADEAVTAARAIGYPVAVKACAAHLMHKSETGAVHLGLADDAAVRQACDRLAAAVEPPLEGILVQEMIQGQRELVIGLNRDPQFGPCVMLGLGGILTEALKDIVFRVAPFDRLEAMEMMDELRAKAILDHFRGQAPADRESLAEALMAVGRIGLDQEAIAEIDINPIIIDAGGRIKAADALIVFRPQTGPV